MRPPSDENACVYPSTRSRTLESSNISANQATAATNSTETPMNVVQRKSRNCHRVVLNAAASTDPA